MEFLLVTYDTSDYYWQNNTPVHNPDEFWFRYYESDTNVPIDNIGVGDWVVVKSRNGLGVARVLKKAKDMILFGSTALKGTSLNRSLQLSILLNAINAKAIELNWRTLKRNLSKMPRTRNV